MRKVALVSVALSAALLSGSSTGRAGAEELTLPAAASIVGGAPFFSDVRAFNTSYTVALNVTATYRCFIGNPCPGTAPSVQFTLNPRQARAFDDMVALTFGAPNTAGGVEFDYTGGNDQLVVTSRLYSTSPVPTVGMFIPGLENNAAHANTVLTSIRNGGDGQGFRTNVGVFNRGSAPVNVTFSIFNAGAPVGAPVVRTVAGHSGLQVSGIFGVAGAGGVATSDGVITVTASGDVFSYAAVIDNATTDPIFVVGAEDQQGSAAPGVRTIQVGPGGATQYRDTQSSTSQTTINVGDTVKWVWDGSLDHSVTAGNCTGGGGDPYVIGGVGGCDPSGPFTSGSHSAPHEFTHTFTQPGNYPYYCAIHGNAMKGRIVVNGPAAAPAPKK